MVKVFYVPGQPVVIDYARPVGALGWMAQHSGLMLAELRVRHPGAVLGDEETFLLDQTRAFATAPQPITEARYHFALEHRQLIDHAGDGESESFKLAEMSVGNITTVYARWRGCYWMFEAVATLPHLLIIQEIARSVMASSSARIDTGESSPQTR